MGEPGRRKGVGVGFDEGEFEDLEDTEYGRLASNQFVHAFAGNPVPFSKVPAQVPPAAKYEEKDEPLSKAIPYAALGGRANVNAELGFMQSDQVEYRAWLGRIQILHTRQIHLRRRT